MRGINIGKAAASPLEAAVDDYRACFERLYPFASYFAINVSSPNTPGLRGLQASEFLKPILSVLMNRNAELARERNERPRPILVKIAPDLDEPQLNEIVDLCLAVHMDGVIVANTTISHNGLQAARAMAEGLGNGGISGRPLTRRARELVAAVYRRTQGGLPIIGVGGIMTPEDAWQMIRAGASLIQVYSGLVYRGPGLVAEINRYVASRLHERGVGSVEAVVGEASEGNPGMAQAPSNPANVLSVNS